METGATVGIAIRYLAPRLSVAKLHGAYQQLLAETLTGSARADAVRLARLKFLAPDIVTAILEGRQPIELNTRTLLRTSELPIGWKEQRRALGFA